MTELYTNTSPVIEFTIPGADSQVMVEVVNRNAIDPGTLERGVVVDSGIATYNADTGTYNFQLDAAATQNPAELIAYAETTVGGEPRTFPKTLFVNVPYVPLEDLRQNPELDDFTDEEIKRMERLVALVVNAFCNQRFDYSLGATKTAMGKHSDYLWLPQRLWQLDDVTVLDDHIQVVRDRDGNIISTDITPRSVVDYAFLDLDNPWRIRNRRNVEYGGLPVTHNYRMFREGNIYAVTGNWGYEWVPGEVAHASRLLVETYFAEDSVYRDRYLDNIRAGNWRMEFRATGDETTGSANADMILSGYKNINMAVI